MQCDFLLVQDIVECRPTAAGIVFGVGAEQLLMADDALVNALLIEFIILAGEWTFGASLLCHQVLHRSETIAELFFGFHAGAGVLVALD